MSLLIMVMKMKTVSILGTEYKILVKKYDEDEEFERRSICGYCNSYTKTIVVCDISTCKEWEHETQETCKIAQNETLRHEIIHAFLGESGLQDSCFAYDGSWAKCEEMIDWFAIQTPKLLQTFKEADCL